MNNNINNPVSNTPLILFQPFNIVVFLSFFSPVIVAVSMVSISFISKNFKGFIFLGFLLGVCLLRNYSYSLSGSTPNVYSSGICNAVQFSKYGNASFSAFVFAFTMMYLFLPMFINGETNFWVISVLITYFVMDISIKTMKKCITNMSDLFLNVLTGMASSALIVLLMYSGGSSKYLFYNEMVSNSETCSMPSKQTFKCQVYKNGELVSG
jgi:hypothetical protein